MVRPAFLAITLVPAALTGVANAQSTAPAGEAHQTVEPTPLGIENARDASGTAWQPDSTPMFMWHARAGNWHLALHTNSFVGYDGTTTREGTGELISMNWLMGMAKHSAGSGDVTIRGMVSADPATMPANGYPLPLQTGEAYHGEPLNDRQHPHELVMEFSLRYRMPLADTAGLDFYFAPVGEPALGPAAFPHRFTAMGDPLAPLGHHWMDSTHITFGVATVGVFTRLFKLEGSYFNGREPDEERWAIDLPRVPDSQSVRLTMNPTREVSAEVSYGRLKSPEWLEEDISQQRLIGSVSWIRPLADDASHFGLTGVAAQQNPSLGPTTYASLVEATALLRDTHTVFARAEALTKTGHDLGLASEMMNTVYGMGSLSAGYVYDFHELPAIVTGVGVVGAIDIIGSDLGAIYDTRTPWAGMVFVRLRPPVMKTGVAPAMSGMHHAM